MKIIEDMKCISLAGQIFGLMPFFEHKRGVLKVSLRGNVYLYFINILLFMISLFVSLVVLNSDGGFTAFRNLEGSDQTTEALFCLISCNLIILASSTNSRRYCGIMQEIGTMDEFLVVRGFTATYSCHFLTAFLAVMAVGLLYTAYYYMHLLSAHFHRDQAILLCIFSMQLLISNLYAICLRVLLGNIRQRIDFVNCHLEISTKSDLAVESNCRQMNYYTELLCKLRCSVDELNMTGGIAMISYMSVAFYILTKQSYMAFMTVVRPIGFEERYDILGLSIAWILAEFITIAVICSACDAVASAANNTAQIIARVYAKGKDYQDIVDKFLSKSIKQNVQFTAYGFFAIDNSTLFKIFSAVTTYLVILIQFKQLEDSKEEE